MQNFSISPNEMIASFWRNRQLIFQMTKREVIGRYRGSIMGLAWSFLNPIIMLVVYTFVFSVVFNARWGVTIDESKSDFAIILFVGLIMHGIFAECVNRAPALILSNANFVKKVVFPLEVLPWVTLCSALFHALVSVLVLLAAELIYNGYIPYTAILFPILLLPLVLATIGVSWFIAAIGVYMRDIGQLTSMFTTILLFTSAVFFPITILPEHYQSWLLLNPLAILIEDGRNVLIFGQLPDVYRWAYLLLTGLVLAWIGFAWFQKTRKGFADVI